MSYMHGVLQSVSDSEAGTPDFYGLAVLKSVSDSVVIWGKQNQYVFI